MSFNAATTMMEYIDMRKAEGATLSLAVRELAGIVCSDERTVWRWYERQAMPAPAARLLAIWRACTQEQRAQWFV